MKQRTGIILSSLFFLALVPAACHSNKPPENLQGSWAYGTDAGAYPTNTYPTTTAAPTYYPDAAAPTTTATATPTATTATPTVFDPAIKELIRTQLQTVAKKEARGMKPEGDLIGGVLQEGQTLEQQVMINPGRCYTVVGLGLPMIQELDIQLMLVPLIPNAPPLQLAVDQTTGAQAVLAGQPNCFKNPTPLAGVAKVVVKATKGSGAVGAQVYVK